MKQRIWQAGDVVLIPGVGVAVGTDDGIWATQVNGSKGEVQMNPNGFVNVRPLVVIDPGDREQVKRLHDMWIAETRKDFPHEGWNVTCMQAALREIANPAHPHPHPHPKPEEPTGLGAVVEDADGVPWVRCENVDLEPHWYARNKQRGYDEITAVRVLSKGVLDG